MVRATNTRPNCTHVTMDMVHHTATCDICHQESSMGWVYECQQDRVQQFVAAEKGNITIDEDDTPLTRDLKHLRFSRSIIKQASEGVYTDDQIEVLKKQKMNVNKVIDDFDRQFEENDYETIHPNITVRRKKHGMRKVNTFQSTVRQTAKCRLKCCHVTPIYSAVSISTSRC
jgi:hypothetical protein